MSRFEDFDPLHGDLPNFPLKGLRGIVWMARGHVARLSKKELRQIERVVEDSLSEQRALYVEQELDSYVANLLEHGGWELGYLEDPERAGERDIRYLLEHWPSEADDRPNLPSEDDLSDVDSLELAIEAHLPASPFGLPSEDPANCAAVLALMLVAEAVETLDWHKDADVKVKSDMVYVGLAAAADSAIEAARAVGLADRLRSEAKLRSSLSIEQRTQIQTQVVRLTRERARQAAEKRHSSMRTAKSFVQAEWEQQGHAYKHNKTDFARTYVQLIRDRFQDGKGHPLRVTEKTIREVWLASPIGSRNSNSEQDVGGKVGRG